MSEKDKLRSMVELMNDALRTVRDYYDSEYAYYVERDDEEITMVYEWCAENIPWQRDRIKMLSPDQFPKWLREEVTDTTEDSYSVFYPMGENQTEFDLKIVS